MTNLFQPGDAPDRAYRNLRDEEWCTEWKAFCESLWARFEPYADGPFLGEIKIQFHQRFWEMYVAVAFLDLDYALHKHKDGGPDFGIDIDGKRYWFDAIAPTAGTGADAVPEIEYGARSAREVPQEKIILRLMGAVDEKRKKWAKDLASGRVAKGEGYVIALNDRAIPSSSYGAELPYIVKGVYGIGNLEVVIDRRTLKTIESRHQHRTTITKVSGAGISAQPFVARECPEVSAILYSTVDAANHPESPGGNFMILHNDEPNVPLPYGALRFAREYWLEDESLNMKNWAETEAASPKIDQV